MDLFARVGLDLIDGTRTIRLQAYGEIAGVRFGYRSEPHLQTSAARGDGHLGYVVQDLIDVLEDAVGLG